MPREPQSYGSEGGWTRGDVGEEVNRQKSGPDDKHRDFYESRRVAEESGPHQGGYPSDDQMKNEAAPEACDTFDSGNEGSKKVTDLEGGARRNGFFKARDYGR